ncbi:hypothetical protein TNCV_471381 [Trichonephila clavipes]|nr:hypothetical protein TNCV_471381 [Trichonephila clavipes]
MADMLAKSGSQMIQADPPLSLLHIKFVVVVSISSSNSLRTKAIILVLRCHDGIYPPQEQPKPSDTHAGNKAVRST